MISPRRRFLKKMSQIAATQIPKPTDEQAFERACVVLFTGILNDPNVQTNGKRGQRQNGVDIFGFRDQDATRPVGIQCKLKGPETEFTEREVRDEVDKALKFVPKLREYIIATTAPDDADIQRVARELTIKSANDGRHISINVWGWQTLEQRINEHGRAMQAFDPTYGVFAKEQEAQLHTVIDQQSVVLREIGNIRSDIGGVLRARNLPGDSTVATNVLEAALDAEIDRYRDDLLNQGKPDLAKEACSGIALEQLLRFRTRDYREIISIMRSEFGYSLAAGYLERWIRGHFLNV